MHENEISYLIRKAAFTVHGFFGPGLFESIYESALEQELLKLGLKVRSQVAVPVEYNNVSLGIGFRMDLLVEEKVIIEIKALEGLRDVHFKQLLSYLKICDKKLGLLINFNEVNINHGIKRIVNDL